MNLTFCELKNKDVINVSNGKNLGNIIDISIDTTCGKILGIIVPSNKNIFNLFKSNNNIFIPYNRICKIGLDIILVDIFMHENNYCNQTINCCDFTQNNQQHQPSINIQKIINDINFKE